MTCVFHVYLLLCTIHEGHSSHLTLIKEIWKENAISKETFSLDNYCSYRARLKTYLPKKILRSRICSLNLYLI